MGREMGAREREHRPRGLGCEMKLLRMMPGMPSQGLPTRSAAYRYAIHRTALRVARLTQGGLLEKTSHISSPVHMLVVRRW